MKQTAKTKSKKAKTVAVDYGYEVEDEFAEEDKCNNKRYDQVDNYEPPEEVDSENDEEIDSDGEDEPIFTAEDNDKFASFFKKKKSSRKNAVADDVEDEDDEASEEEEEEDDDDQDEAQAVYGDGEEDGESESDLDFEEEQDGSEEAEARYARMRDSIFSKGNNKEKKTNHNAKVLSEAFPEAEYNVNPASGTAVDTNTQLSVDKLVGALGRDAGSLRRKLEKAGKRGEAVTAPLPATIQARVEREAAYEQGVKDVTKWQGVVKMNREVATLKFPSTKAQ
ncbi:hypothetical protein CYMTET_13577, partial [Cymbomonas tetramitiformis]